MVQGRDAAKTFPLCILNDFYSIKLKTQQLSRPLKLFGQGRSPICSPQWHYFLPEDAQVGRLVQNLIQSIHHDGVKHNRVHGPGQLMVLSQDQSGFADTGVGLESEPVHPKAAEV